MRILKALTMLVAVLVLARPSFADSAQTVDLYGDGEYTITSAWCASTPCPVTQNKFSGPVTATIVGDKIFFSNIKFVIFDDAFTFPEDPYNAGASGTQSSAKFTFDGTVLLLDGVIDSRAFDGPLINYHLKAQRVIGPVDEAFNPQGYYLVRKDLRKCASPQCGGIFVKSVNQPATECADGKRAKECYIAEEDYGKLGFNPFAAVPAGAPRTQLLLRGTITPSTASSKSQKLGRFTALAAYRPASSAEAKNNFYGLEDNGIRCITSPCFSLTEYLLNSPHTTKVSDFDLSTVKSSEDDLATAYNLLGEGDVVPVAGVNKRTRLPNGSGLKLVANQFYLPIKAPAK
ncbi:MAG TPA: DUF6748 domain-containing protein [Cellvibrionaceae bacterium]